MKLSRYDADVLTATIAKEIIEKKKKKMKEMFDSDEVTQFIAKMDEEYEKISEEMKLFLWRYGEKIGKPSERENAREKACFALGKDIINPYYCDTVTLRNDIVCLWILCKDMDDFKLDLNEVIDHHVNETKYNKLLHEVLK